MQILLVALLLLSSFSMVHAESYDITPGVSVADVGFAFDPIQPESPPPNTFYRLTKPPIRSEVVGSRIVNYEFVTNHSSLVKTMMLNAYASGRYGAIKGDGSYSRLSQMTFESDTVTAVMYIRQTYAPTVKDGDVILTELGEQEVNKVRTPADANAFLKAGGSEIVTSLIRGGFVYIVYQFKGTNTTDRQQIEAAFAASYKGGIIKAGAGVKNLSEILESNSNIRMSFVLVDAGLDNIPAKRALIDLLQGAAADLSNVKKAMGDLADSLSFKSSAVVSFDTTVVTQIAGIPPDTKALLMASKGNGKIRQRAISYQIEAANDIKTKLDLAEYLLNAPIDYLVSNRVPELKAERRMLFDALQRALANIDRGSVDADTEKVHEFDPMRYVLLPLVKNAGYAEDYFWGGRKSCNPKDNLYQCSPWHWEFFPRFEVTLPALVKSVRFRATDGSFSYEYKLADASRYSVQMREPIQYLSFGSEAWIGIPPKDIRDREYAKGKLLELLNRQPYLGRTYVLEVLDYSNRIINVPMASLSDVNTKNIGAIDPRGYGGLSNLDCQYFESANMVCSMR